MRILTWNILHGGGRERTPQILMAMLDMRPDVLVITETRRRFAGQLAGALADTGLPYAHCPDSPDGVNGVMIVSRFPLRAFAAHGAPRPLETRWVEVHLPEQEIHLAGVHLPEAGRAAAHAESWRFLLRRARERRDEPTILAGDLNTWRDGPDRARRTGASATNLGRLASLGYADTWQSARGSASGPTWKGPRGEDLRLDYVLVSGSLACRVRGAEVVQPGGGARLSDHAALVVEIAEPGEKSPGAAENRASEAESPTKTGASGPGPLAL